jgi:hypothetical protein
MYAYTHTYMHTHLHIYIHTCVYLSVYMYERMHVCVYVGIHLHLIAPFSVDCPGRRSFDYACGYEQECLPVSDRSIRLPKFRTSTETTSTLLVAPKANEHFPNAFITTCISPCIYHFQILKLTRLNLNTSTLRIKIPLLPHGGHTMSP